MAALPLTSATVVRRARLGPHQRSARSVITMDFDITRHGVALKPVASTRTFARLCYGVGSDEGPYGAGSNKKCNRENDPVSQGHERPSLSPAHSQMDR